MKIPGISTDAIDSLRDELIHWLDRYEEKLNEAEELLYRTVAAIRQADQTLADNMKEFGLELLGWYDLQRVFGEYDPVTGERLSFGDRLFAGGMLLLSIIPPAKGAGVAGKAAIKGAKAAGIAAEVSKWSSKTKNVLNVDKIKGALQTIYHQVIKGPITATIRSFKHQWEQLPKNVGSVLMGPQLAVEGVGVAPSGRMIGIAEESANSVRISMSQAGDGVIGKGTGGVAKGTGKVKLLPSSKVHDAIGKLNSNQIKHIINGSKKSNHQWEKLVPDKNWGKIKEIIIDVMHNGADIPYKSVSSRVKMVNGQLVQMTYKNYLMEQ